MSSLFIPNCEGPEQLGEGGAGAQAGAEETGAGGRGQGAGIQGEGQGTGKGELIKLAKKYLDQLIIIPVEY